jgi:hypothetical protein
MIHDSHIQVTSMTTGGAQPKWRFLEELPRNYFSVDYDALWVGLLQENHSLSSFFSV